MTIVCLVFYLETILSFENKINNIVSIEAIQVMPPRLTYRLHGYKELLPVTQQSFHHYQQELNTNEAMFISVNKLKMSYILRRNEYPS